MSASIGSDGQAMARPWSCRGRGRRRPGRAAGLIGVAVGLATALAACTPAQPPSSAAAGGSQPAVLPGMSCAWPDRLSAQADNTAFPDAAEAYFWQPIVASAGTRIVLSGRFPDARYASVQVYTPGGVGSSLPDYRIAPQPGSLNPWQQHAAPGGRFTVTIAPDPAPGQVNTLPLPAGTTSQHTGYLAYRVYLPAGGAPSDVPLPVLTMEQGGAARTLPACPSHNAPVHFPAVSGSAASAAGAGGSGAAAPPPPQLEFFKPPQSTFNNGGTRQRRHQLRPGLPGPPPGARRGPRHGQSAGLRARQPSLALAGPGEDVRYWSMCIGLLAQPTPVVANKLPGGGTDYGCRADEATRLNAAGDYTYAIGSESQRAAISRVPGVTFLPFSTTQASRLYLPGPAERAGQHVVRALAPGRHAGQRPGGGRGRHGPLLPAHGGLPAGDPHRPRPAGMPAVSKVGGMRYIISIRDRTDIGDAMVRTCGQAGGARWGQEAGGSER